MNNIKNDGYLILKNILTQKQLDNGLKSDNNGIVCYKSMKQYIDTDFIPTISSNVDFLPKPKYIKFRYSNNNNSTDASTFHSDVYNNTIDETIPIYTCLCYFDKTQLEVIPGSHKKQFQQNNNSVNAYFQKKIIDIEPGDIMIFHANLYHRGTNFDTKGNRRLLQVFEVFPDEETFNKNYDKFITVITANTAILSLANYFSYILSKIPFVIDSISFVHFILVYNDLQYKIGLNDLAPWDKKDKLITYEPGKRMKYESITGKDETNVNIICEKSITTPPSYFYFIFYIIYWIVSLFLLYYIVKWFDKKGIFKQPFKVPSRSGLYDIIKTKK
jgi:hypothetical protein